MIRLKFNKSEDKKMSLLEHLELIVLHWVKENT